MSWREELMDVQQYMRTLPDTSLEQLYSSSSTCQTVFRSLPPVSQQYIMRLLFVTSPVNIESIHYWSKRDVLDKHEKLVERLIGMKVFKIIESVDQQSGMARKAIVLNPTFQKSLQAALTGRATTESVGNLGPDKNAPTKQRISEVSNERWENILHFILDPSNSPLKTSDSDLIRQLGTQMGILEMKKRGGTQHIITKQGNRYLMGDTHTQWWGLVRAYVDIAPDRQMDKDAVLSFIFQLGFLQFGHGYSVDVSPAQRPCLDDMCRFGFVYRKGRASRYYPSNLAINLSRPHTTQAKEELATDSDKYIVLETNFKIYAFTASDFRVRVLSLFSEIKCRLPNLVAGQITRDSCLAAFQQGLSAAHILGFLESHSHPQVTRRPIIPDGIAEQITIWEQEQNRIEHKAACVYDKFQEEKDFRKAVEKATEIGCLLHSSPHPDPVLAVSHEGHEEMKAFFKANGM